MSHIMTWCLLYIWKHLEC